MSRSRDHPRCCRACGQPFAPQWKRWERDRKAALEHVMALRRAEDGVPEVLDAVLDEIERERNEATPK